MGDIIDLYNMIKDLEERLEQIEETIYNETNTQQEKEEETNDEEINDDNDIPI